MSFLDNFVLTPSGGGSEKPIIPDGPEVVDKTTVSKEEFEEEGKTPVNKSQTKIVKKDESSKISDKEVTSEKSSQKGSEESDEGSEEESGSEKTIQSEGSQESSSEEGSEEVDLTDLDLTDFAKEIYSGLGLEGEFDKDEFINDFGGKDLDAVLKFTKAIIDENSKVVHPNAEAEKYYNYVAGGGDPKKLSYLLDVEAQYNDIKAEDLADNEQLQKGVLRSYLKKINPKKDDTWVDNKIQKLIDSGLAAEEAVEAIEELKSLSKEETEAELKAQKDAQKEEERKQKEHWETIQMKINQAENLAGVKLDKAGKEKFLNYIKSGQYNKFLQNIDNSIELALVAYLGGFEKASGKQGMTKATNKLEQNLARYTSKGANLKSQTIPKIDESGTKKVNYDAFLMH